MGKVKLGFKSYHKYKFSYFAELNDLKFYGSIGGNPSNIYRLNIPSNDYVLIGNYMNLDYFKVSDIDDNIIFEFNEQYGY